MKGTRLTIVTAMLLVAAMLLAGCKDERTKVSSILGRTNDFVNREVVVEGEVTKTHAADLVIAEAGVYQVDDGTGKIWVLTKNGVPKEGQTVVVKGTVSSGLQLAGESFGAFLREIDRRTR